MLFTMLNIHNQVKSKDFLQLKDSM